MRETGLFTFETIDSWFQEGTLDLLLPGIHLYPFLPIFPRSLTTISTIFTFLDQEHHFR